MKRSSMFLNDITNVDHAYINSDGMIIGGSYRPKMIITGVVDPIENVVVDFSTVKKTIKQSIDDLETGFDHKLWWIDGVSKGKISFKDGRVSVKTTFVEIEGPANIVRVISGGEIPIQDHVFSCLDKIYPESDIEVECNLTNDFDLPFWMNTQPHLFRMVHGLKVSTSVPCQNIGHGHLNFLGAETNDILNSNITLAKIADTLDSKVFAWSDNLKGNDLIKYSCSRGDMVMKIYEYKMIMMHNETTVENIVEWISKNWYEELKSSGVTRLFCSEGLSKGACINI